MMTDAERRELGAHYTSEENIFKVINPLFLDDLKAEFYRCQRSREHLIEFQSSLSKLTFLDPACGHGNFLIVVYRELRALELECAKLLLTKFDHKVVCRVSLDQVNGIEYDAFSANLATLALVMCDRMANHFASAQLGMHFYSTPNEPHIVCDNALSIDWETAVPKHSLTYIIGNPPFVGASVMGKRQKHEMTTVVGRGKRASRLDYVCAWFYKAARLIVGTNIRVAYVSTSSIVRGEQVEPLWGALINECGIHIDFAYMPFRWTTDAPDAASVWCVIVGFSACQNPRLKVIYDAKNVPALVRHINPYLLDYDDIIVSGRRTALCDVPSIFAGNKPVDGGHLILTPAERDEMIARDPSIAPCIRQYVSARDFLSGKNIRYCLWLKGISPSVYRDNKDIMERLEAVREFRNASSAAPTRRFADKPHLFFSSPQTNTTHACIPEITSKKREYIPIGFIHGDEVVSNKLLLIPHATMYHFGVLQSRMHMVWMRTVGGRFGDDYQYSGAVVYNTFPWPETTKTTRLSIESAAHDVLEARKRHADHSLAWMYNPITMPPDLRLAHTGLDSSVAFAYGGPFSSDEEIAVHLLRLYHNYSHRKSLFKTTIPIDTYL